MLAVNEVLGAKILVADEAGDVGDGNRLSDRLKHIKPKTGKMSKVQKLFKSQKSAKSKKLSKSGNLPNFGAMASSDQAF